MLAGRVAMICVAVAEITGNATPLSVTVGGLFFLRKFAPLMVMVCVFRSPTALMMEMSLSPPCATGTPSVRKAASANADCMILSVSFFMAPVLLCCFVPNFFRPWRCGRLLV